MHVGLAILGLLVIAGAFIGSGAVDPQPSVAVFPLLAIAGGTLMATSVAAAARAARTQPQPG